MEWHTLLDRQRLSDTSYEEKADRPSFVQDADRITFSTPFRRLANKTQVHPLYENDHLHHRLIHSVETASVGRSLGIAIGDWLEKEHSLPVGEKHVVAGIVQAACLAHDIGNPPFGHSGEAAIGEWFSQKFTEKAELFEALDKNKRGEFEAFEGNAQGFRVITRLEMYRNNGGMCLSRSVLAAFSKYPTTAHTQSIAKQKHDYCGLKKFGIFHSELELFAEVAKGVGLPEEGDEHARWWRRHPLVFLVEAADDICYNILDLEDAFTSGDFTKETVMDHLNAIAGKSNRIEFDRRPEEEIAHARARSIGSAIAACVEAFKENYEDIMSGTFSNSLIGASRQKAQFKNIGTLASQRLFTSPRKTELEVLGRNVVHQVLDGLEGVYTALMKNGWQAEDLDGYHKKLCRATGLDLRDVTDSYTALHSLGDYVSGMTDRYAVKIARMVSGT